MQAVPIVPVARLRTQSIPTVAGYPEGHEESSSYEEDLENLRKKVWRLPLLWLCSLISGLLHSICYMRTCKGIIEGASDVLHTGECVHMFTLHTMLAVHSTLCTLLTRTVHFLDSKQAPHAIHSALFTLDTAKLHVVHFTYCILHIANSALCTLL